MGFSIGGALGGLADVVGGLATGVLNNYYNKKAQSRQNEVQWQFWNANNDYNSPASVMQRLEEAGLNPNLVYQNGGASYQATMPTAAKRAPADFNLGGFSPVTFQQLENMEAQNDLIAQQGRNAKVQEQILRNQNRISKKDADIYEQTGVRPGDDVSKGIWHSFVDNVKEMQLSHLRELFPIFKAIMTSKGSDNRNYSQNNSSNVKFYG